MRRELRSAIGQAENAIASFIAVACDSRRGRISRSLGNLFYGPSKNLPVFWYRGRTNFGDLLSPIIVDYVSGRSVRYSSGTTRGKILALGSILHEARAGDVVWGSGAIREGRLNLAGVRVLALRGPRTRRLLRSDAPKVYGDPAVLMPMIYRPVAIERYEVGIVPHYIEPPLGTPMDPRVRVIDVTNTNWQRTIDEICSCDVVLSSSLHGLIVAEAYGVPAVWVEMSSRVTGSGFKFFDYYESTGREGLSAVPWSAGLAAAVNRAEAPPAIDGTSLLDSWPSEWRG